jgi:predicted RNA-binding protein with PUA-like domain
VPNYWLLKTEPSTYSYDDLERDGKAVWDGVSNPVALKHLRAMAAGDRCFIYHTGDEKRVVGIARVTKPAYPDPKTGDPRLVVVDLAPVQRIARPVTLAEVKADRSFADWELVRIGRLSVMPVSPERWRRIASWDGQ